MSVFYLTVQSYPVLFSWSIFILISELLASHPQFPAFSGTDEMPLIELSAFQGSEKNPRQNKFQRKRGISRMFVEGIDMSFISW